MGIDLRPFSGWAIVKKDRGWQLRHSPYPGREHLVCESDDNGRPTLYGLRDLLNREYGTPPLGERCRRWISIRLAEWSRWWDPDFWPEGRHGMHRIEPGGSWVPGSGRSGSVSYPPPRIGAGDVG